MKILISAYACAPHSGSDQGVAWWWVTDCAKRHKVSVLTCEAQRESIEAELAHSNDLDISFYYVKGASKVSASGTEYRFERIKVYLWQLKAIRAARRLSKQNDFDLAQHLTISTWRAPTCLAFTRIPLIIGPVSGSEVLPRGFAIRFGFRALIWSTLRSVQIRLSKVDPLISYGLRRSKLILVSSPLTFTHLRNKFGSKVQKFDHAFESVEPHRVVKGPRGKEYGNSILIKVAWMGQLIPRKGLDLLLHALSDASLLACRLQVLGDGPNRKRYERLAQQLGIGERVVFTGHIPRIEALNRLAVSDVFVFTSLQDMMGQALSEAMQLGLPCVVMDWGGPAALVGTDGAAKIPVTDYEQTYLELRRTLTALCNDPNLREEYSRAALRRIRTLTDPEYISEKRERFFSGASARNQDLA